MKTCFRYLAVAVLLCAATNFANAQNLVVNPSFEITATNCSAQYGENMFTELTGSWDNANSNIDGDSCSSPDLYSACNIVPGSNVLLNGVPSSILGNQYSHTGTRHVGVILYSSGDEYREYIQGRTTSPLIAGKAYEVSFYVNLPGEVLFATNGFGVRFTNTHFLRDACAGLNVADSSAIYLTPQLIYSDSIITDTTNWVQLKWNYVAAGGEQYFIIGNFFNNTHTAIVSTGSSPFFPFAYYFIDDVSIKPAYTCSDSIVIDSIIRPGCAVSNGSLSATVLTLPTDTLPYVYVWNTGDSIQNLTGVASGIYSVTASNSAGCEITKSFVLNDVFADSVSLYAVDATCSQNNGAITVDVISSVNRTYYWNTSANTQAITNLAKGTYSVTVTFANGCVVVDSAIVSGPIINVTAAANGICPGDSVQLCAPNGYSSYLWSNGAITACISVNQADSYHVSVTDNSNCTEVSGDVILNSFYPTPVTAVISGGQITAITSAAQGFQWLLNNNEIPGATGQNYTPLQNGNYSVAVINSSGCKSYSNVVHYAISCNAYFILFPDSLTVHNWFSQVFTTGAQPITYNWQWGDGTSSTGLNSHTYAAPGRYNICLSITDANGCTDTYCDSSTYLSKTEEDMVKVNPVLELPNAVAEASDDVVTSVYPNPANNLLYIKTGGLKVNAVYIYDVTGSLVKTALLLNAGEGLDISLLSAGVYVADIITKDAGIRKRWLKM